MQRRNRTRQQKFLILGSSSDQEVIEEARLRYAFHSIAKQWMDEVKVFLFGPAEKPAVCDSGVQTRLKDLPEAAGLRLPHAKSTLMIII
jgi:hypothetical protein